MESGDIITEKKDEKSSEIFDELQQKKLFAEKELEIKSQEEEKKEVETQENTLADITEEKVLPAEGNLKIEKEEKIEVQETSTNNESEKEEVNLKETTESEIVSEEPEEEKKDEIIVENVVAENLEEKRDPKDITILTDNDDVRLVESGLEIQYTSLHLNNFPISYSNFSNELSFNEVISVGTSTVKIGETLLNNTSLKILVYDKFKLLEIKTREFKVALSIDLLNGETLVKNGDFYKYEIFNKIKNSRFIEVVNILKEIFSGAKIEFKFKKLVGDITFENRIEVYKFNLLQELANSYKNIVNSFSLNREKNFAEITNSFYEVFLTEAILEGKKIDSWINFRIKNSFDIQAGDNLTFERVHKLEFRGINFDIKEIIKVKSEVSEREFTKDNEICGYRKAVEISLEKVEKFN
ncbi:hypothetical protein [uncultured Fusobacterium sp.]|uniref:hypothetical protein n=1 Tax=uncultured Fusobacterium sp. TaxID=159267 RepID=UPI0025F1F579|nr:hypothetical protein [uncultured Fusobacterium sp.]